tara:strand:+ start:1516 stop:2232 length:717 start_codon:yes stop_codon:yes gene_type:complete
MSFIIAGITIGSGLLISGTGKIINGAVKNKNARKDKNEASVRLMKNELKLQQLEASRQEIINPYADVKSLTGDMSNPFANLSVATGAAEIQMQQSDAALANTLDTLRATGAGGGGATALAQAALQSKKGVAASIEGQEVANQKLRAQGEQSLQQSVVREKERLQDAEIAGSGFMYSEKEKRETTQLDRTQNKIDRAESDKRNAEQNRRDGNEKAADDVSKFGMGIAKAGVGYGATGGL